MAVAATTDCAALGERAEYRSRRGAELELELETASTSAGGMSWGACAWGLRVMAGALLCAVAVLAAILLGISWDNTAHAAHDDDFDLVATVVLLALPAGVFLLALGLRSAWNHTTSRSRSPPTGAQA